MRQRQVRVKMSPRQTALKNGEITYIAFCKICDKETVHETSNFMCKPCRARYRKNNKEVRNIFNKSIKGKKQNTRARLKRRYGITEFDWLKMYEEQGGKCLMSNCTFISHDKWWEQTQGGFCVDHCHKTGKIRGLLCAECNKITGKIENNIKLVHDQIKHVYNFMS